MIFDERDLEEDSNLGEEKENIIPSKNQMSFDDFFGAKSQQTIANKDEKKLKKEDKINKNNKVIEQKQQSLQNLSKSSGAKKTSKKLNENLLDKLQKAELEAIKEEQERKENESEKRIGENEKNINSGFGGGNNGGFSNQDPIEMDGEGNYIKSVKTVMNEAMMPYSEYVILDRALPRVEDGLKPVQRRILYSMYELGLTPDKPFKKSAKIVGDVIANYHPHGDTSVYNAMVKLAQDFNMRERLVMGHGNFGSVDGDPPAAYRYTEAKLNSASLELLRDLDKETVKWSYNFDDSKFEPDMLPSRFPNILVNGTMGIAVGIATNFACHNLAESIDACIAYIDNPNISVDELMKVLKGPDFPTGAIIVGTDEIKKAYETGKGKITIRAKIDIENAKNDKINLIISEFPYGVNKAMCIQKIDELAQNNKDTLSCITDIRDESDRNGTRAVITLKKDCDPQKIINYLYKYSDLQITFGINMVAIADGKPKLLNLLDILRYYTKYQKEIIFKRSTFELNQAKEREHILSGLIIAIENIDEIVKIIKKSASTVIAKQELRRRYDLSERQAQAILDMRLSRLTNLEVEKLKEEIDALLKLINKLTKIVNSDKLQYNLVKEEMLEIKKRFNDKRRTKIVNESGIITDDDIIKVVKPMYVLTTEKQAIKKIPEKTFAKSAKILTDNSTLNEIHNNILLTSSDKNILIFTNIGNVYKLAVDKIIEARFKDRGVFLKDLIVGFNPDEKVVKIFEENDKLFKSTLIFFTKTGLVKLTKGDEYQISKSISQSMKLKDDEIINIEIFDKNKNLMFVSSLGMGLYCKNDDIPQTSKTSGGVKGISLNDGDECLFASQIENEKLLLITNKGYSKKVELSNFELLAKNRKGVKVYSLGKGESTGTNIVFAGLISNDYDLFVTDTKNKNFVVDSSNIQISNRTNKGSIILKDRKLIDLKSVYKIIVE